MHQIIQPAGLKRLNENTKPTWRGTDLAAAGQAQAPNSINFLSLARNGSGSKLSQHAVAQSDKPCSQRTHAHSQCACSLLSSALFNSVWPVPHCAHYTQHNNKRNIAFSHEYVHKSNSNPLNDCQHLVVRKTEGTFRRTRYLNAA